MLVDSVTWSRRSDCRETFPAVSLSTGLPQMDCRSWDHPAGRIGHPTVATDLPLRELDDGIEFDLTSKRKMAFRRLPQITLPGDTLWVPEFGMAYVEFFIDERPSVVEQDGDDFIFPVALDLGPDVVLHYQPALTAEDIAEGCERPDWCVGSFAVYHVDGRKLGHIPRPFCRDADGATLWGRFDRVGRQMVKRFNAAALLAMRRPLRIDLTFGYTTQGVSALSSGGTLRANAASSPASSGTTSLVWVAGYDSGDAAVLGFYASSGGNPDGQALVGGTSPIALPASADWVSSACVVAVTASTSYHVAWHNDAFSRIMYDTTAGTYRYSAETYTGAMIDPCPTPLTETPDRTLSLYVEYTAAGGAAARNYLLGGGII